MKIGVFENHFINKVAFQNCPKCGKKGFYQSNVNYQRCKYCGYAESVK